MRGPDLHANEEVVVALDLVPAPMFTVVNRAATAHEVVVPASTCVSRCQAVAGIEYHHQHHYRPVHLEGRPDDTAK